MTALWVRIQNWLAEHDNERGQTNWTGGLGVIGVVIVVLIFFWLAESAGKTNFFD